MGCDLLSECGRECDSESMIPALASGPPAPPNRSARGRRFRRFGTVLGHLLFLSPWFQSLRAVQRLPEPLLSRFRLRARRTVSQGAKLRPQASIAKGYALCAATPVRTVISIPACLGAAFIPPSVLRARSRLPAVVWRILANCLNRSAVSAQTKPPLAGIHNPTVPPVTADISSADRGISLVHHCPSNPGYPAGVAWPCRVSGG